MEDLRMARDRSDTGIVELQIVTDCSNMPQACDGLAHVAAPVCLSVAGTCWGWVGTMVLPTLARPADSKIQASLTQWIDMPQR